jgi:insertion element IS1 protein InsB
LPNAHESEPIPEGVELDELETFVGSKKNKVWLWTAVDHLRKGILGWVIGEWLTPRCAIVVGKHSVLCGN